MRDDLARRGTAGLLVQRGDQTLLEWYAEGWSAERPHYTASLAKALVGGLSLMLTLEEGRLGADDPAARYVAQWQDHPQKRAISIRHLATHSSGLEDAEHIESPDWMRRFWAREPDPFTISRDETPLLFEAGTGYEYSNPGMAMLAYGVTAALQGTAWPDIRTLLRERVFEPIGLGPETWSIGYGQTYKVDGLPLVANWGGGSFTARAIGRIGRLMLQRGTWQGRQLVDADLVRQGLAYAGTPLPSRSRDPRVPASGLCWYSNEDGVWPEVPRDAFAGAGAGHQLLVVVPSLDLVVVRQGEHLEGERSGPFWEPAYGHLLAPLLEFVK